MQLFLKDKNSQFIDTNFDSLKEIDVLFVGASPKLEEEIHLIKENRNNLFIISSDTAIGYLLSENVVPDCIVSIDSGRGTNFHLEMNIPDSIPIITWFGGNRKIFELNNPKYIYLSTFPIDQLIQEKFLSKIELIENPSLNVSGLALNFAKKLGARNFILAGVSFQSYRGKTHCRGTGFEKFKLHNINRKVSIENSKDRVYSKEISPKNKNALSLLFNSGAVKLSDHTFQLPQEKNFNKTKIHLLDSKIEMDSIRKLLQNHVLREKITISLQLNKTYLDKFIKIKKNS